MIGEAFQIDGAVELRQQSGFAGPGSPAQDDNGCIELLDGLEAGAAQCFEAAADARDPAVPFRQPALNRFRARRPPRQQYNTLAGLAPTKSSQPRMRASFTSPETRRSPSAMAAAWPFAL